MAKKFIDADILYKKIHNIGGCDAPPNTWAKGWDEAVDGCLNLLESMPAADVQEVVRCKNCKHFFRELKGDNHLCMKSFFANPVTPDDYCSYGARMDGEENDKC